jgi:hypothetical protein
MNLLTLHGRNKLAGEASQEPLAPVEALGEGGRDADRTHRDAGNGQVHYVQVLRCPVVFLSCKSVKFIKRNWKGQLGMPFRKALNVQENKLRFNLDSEVIFLFFCTFAFFLSILDEDETHPGRPR